jgi:hypothetical protein
MVFPFFNRSSFHLATTDIDDRTKEAVEHFSAKIAHFSKRKIFAFAVLEL